MPKKKVTEAVEETAQETIPVEKAPAQMPRRQGSEDLLELNDLERGVTREDSEEAKWGYLAGAVRRQQILTGIVSAGMTYTENGMPIVPIDFEGLCVKIPVREMTLIEWPEDEPIPRSVRVQIGRMLGATIDFIPAGVDFKERVAIGSRKAAMLQRQKRYYASGRVKPGILMACRVLTVGNMIGISKRLLLIPVQHPKYSVRNPSEPLATCILTMRMSLKSSGNIAAAELSIRQPKSWTCAFLSMASRETRAAKKTAIRLFCEEGSLWNML